MKTDKNSSITGPLLKDIVDRDLAQQAAIPSTVSCAEPPAELMQDNGGGYNSDFEFPQQ